MTNFTQKLIYRWILRVVNHGNPWMDWDITGPNLEPGESVEVMPVVEHRAEVRDLHGLLADVLGDIGPDQRSPAIDAARERISHD